MLDTKNEALERLMDGGDDANSVNLFGKAINVESRQSADVPSNHHTTKDSPVKKLRVRRVIFCVSIMLVSAVGALTLFHESKSVVVKAPLSIHRPVELVKKEIPNPVVEVSPVATSATGPIDLDALKTLLDKSIVPKLKAIDANATSGLVSDVEKKTPKIDLSYRPKLVSVLKPQNTPVESLIRKVVEPKVIILPANASAVSSESSSLNKPDNAMKQIQPIQLASAALSAGDKLSSGETVLNVSPNGDIVTDMRIIKKGQK
ncbi:MAG: hypothetical protein Q7K26_00545 [bacterium]|nr:hypothetical protein [bacterium]